MKKILSLLLIVALVAPITSCATSQGCNYKKAQKFNQKQMRKANRYYRHR